MGYAAVGTSGRCIGVRCVLRLAWLGMASLKEVADIVDVVERTARSGFTTASAAAGAGAAFTLLHCLSSYPAPAEQCNLRAMATMRSAFNVPVG